MKVKGLCSGKSSVKVKQVEQLLCPSHMWGRIRGCCKSILLKESVICNKNLMLMVNGCKGNLETYLY